VRQQVQGEEEFLDEAMSKHEMSSDKGKLNVTLMSPPCPCFEEIVAQ
jgi:hypothetical protein